ncbi:RAD54 [Symbiodinium microadriaticum]|nr:RAD54 [Symbiodinium sp. KB8]CAE7864798.1 RAD54 [Symbiodinium microadriaticum]
MAFLSEISTLCNRGVAAAHLALAQSVLLLTAQADFPLLQPQRKPMRAPTCHNGGFQSSSAEAWVSRLSKTQMEVVAKELPELSYAGLRIPMRRQNLSSFTQAVLAEDIAQLLEEAWTILAGEQLEGLLEGTWPLAELGWKFFACLTVIRPPPQILRRGRFS